MLPNSYVLQNLYERLYVRSYVLPNSHVHLYVHSSVLPNLYVRPYVHSWGGHYKKKKKLGPWLMKLYTTPPSILTLVTWVPQSRLAFGHSARRLAIGPLAKRNPTVSSLACRWRLRSALRADQESFSIETHPLSLIVRPDYTAPSSPTEML